MTSEQRPTILLVFCPNCSNPTKVPPEVENNIETITGFDCWSCKQKVLIDEDFRYYVIATREETP